MQVKSHRPVARGVSQLMYVGDVDTSATFPFWGKVALAVGAAWLLYKHTK